MELSLAISGEWLEWAACRGIDPEVFFPPQGRLFTEARAICAGCPVTTECRAYIDRSERGCGTVIFGFAGGESPVERIQRRRSVAPHPSL